MIQLPFRFSCLIALSLTLSFAACKTASKNTGQTTADPWDQVPAILEQIKKPTFRDKDYLITDFGAVGNGATDCSAAFRKAIETCHQEGGGRVVVPAGNFMLGPFI